ncbi:MAG TPA: polysaccharide deacetylase family protein [Methylomirabilota bacterium]|nr:polysaccharide deacetylase family protein [Methylomirabilota bacterium]
MPSSLRGRLKSGAAAALSSTGADALIGRLADARTLPVVLGYHRVVDDFATEARRAIPAMLTSRAMLERQLDWVGRRFQFVTLDELGERLEQGRDLSRVAAVTFDDGYRDAYEIAFPLLQRKGIPAAVFVVSDVVGTRELLVHDRLHLLLARAFQQWPDPPAALGSLLRRLCIRLPGAKHLKRRAATPVTTIVLLLRALCRRDIGAVMAELERQVGLDEAAAAGMLPLTWEMLAEMQRAGVIVGSHTRTHAWLTRENRERVLDEAQGARRIIEKRLGAPVKHFAYPDGAFTPATAWAVAMAGYHFAYTTCMHRAPRHPSLTLPRRMLWENSCVDTRGRFSPAVMSCHAHGVFGLFFGCQQGHAS